MLRFRRRRRRARRRGFLIGRALGRRNPVATDRDPTPELARLADLRDRGALTNQEFERAKQQLLGE